MTVNDNSLLEGSCGVLSLIAFVLNHLHFLVRPLLHSSFSLSGERPASIPQI
jgi:hypothetical protein